MTVLIIIVLRGRGPTMVFAHKQENKMKSGIYSIVNIINNKIYIGSSRYLSRRKNQHFNNLRKNKHSNNHLQTAWNKYGEENFKFFIIEECLEENLLFREQYYIDKHKAYDREIGYNKSITANGVTKIPRIHCKDGHELSGDNLRLTSGERLCRKCIADKAKAKYIKKERLKTRAARQNCLKGHEMTEENTGFHNRLSGRNSRYCKACSNARDKKYRKTGKIIKLPKSHCLSGHLLIKSNLYENKGRKRCLTCLKLSYVRKAV